MHIKIINIHLSQQTIKKTKTMTLSEIKTTLEDLSQGYQDAMRNLPIWSEIMQLADEKGHYASEIVEKAVMNKKYISEKQAWVVAFFAKNNGLIKK